MRSCKDQCIIHTYMNSTTQIIKRKIKSPKDVHIAVFANKIIRQGKTKKYTKQKRNDTRQIGVTVKGCLHNGKSVQDIFSTQQNNKNPDIIKW